MDGQEGVNETLSVFIKTKKGFKGRIRVYDAFFTKKEMLLYVKVKEDFCAETNKEIITFEVSHSEFKDPVWDLFKEVKLKVKCD